MTISRLASRMFLLVGMHHKTGTVADADCRGCLRGRHVL
jgi:hypothetical protein